MGGEAGKKIADEQQQPAHRRLPVGGLFVSIRVVCSNCRKRSRFPDQFAGSQAACRKCGTTLACYWCIVNASYIDS